MFEDYHVRTIKEDTASQVCSYIINYKIIDFNEIGIVINKKIREKTDT